MPIKTQKRNEGRRKNKRITRIVSRASTERQSGPKEGSETFSATAHPEKLFLKNFLKKMAIAVRLFGREIHRAKLRCFDLRAADYHLGKKAYETQSSMSDQKQTIDRINKIQDQIKALGNPDSFEPAFKQKIKAAVKEAGRLIKIQILKFRRNHALRKLGDHIRHGSEAHAELTPEIDNSRNVANEIGSVNSDIRGLAVKTYFWARRPLLTSAIVLAVVLLCSGLIHHQAQSQPSSTPTPVAQSDPKMDALIAELFSTAAAKASSASTPASSAKLRSEDSLAVERYLRSRLMGGATESQIIQLSDAIAEKFLGDIASEDRSHFISGTGNERQVVLGRLSLGTEGGPQDSKNRAMEKLMSEIQHMIPPRAVFFGLFEWDPSPYYRDKEKPLPAIEGPIGEGYRPAGSLVREYLQSLKTVISDRSPNVPASETAWNQIKELHPGDILVCTYQGGFRDTAWAELFWHKKSPDGLDRVLKILPSDHPIRRIGPARESAPASLDVAMQANPNTAEDLKKGIADEKERAARPVQTNGPKVSNADKFWTVIGALVIGATVLDLAHPNDSKPSSNEGWEQVRCSRCNGSGLVKEPLTTISGARIQGDPVQLVKCSECNGKGFLEKRGLSTRWIRE